MSPTLPGRHRAPRRLSIKPVARASAIAATSAGLVLSMSGGAQAVPSQPFPAAPAFLPTTPSALPVTPRALPTTPIVSHPTTPSTWSTIRWGARGTSVERVQAIVGADVDGVFGPQTYAAVKSWQSRHDLVADGIVGPLTTRAMGLASTRFGSSASTPASRSTSGVLAYAAQYTGIRYSWGGSSPSTGFDCSGYTQFVFAQIGIDLPRTAEAQRRFATPVSSPRPGDLVFWGYPATHMAIYAGDGMIYDSGRSGLSTQKRKMFSGVTSYGRVG